MGRRGEGKAEAEEESADGDLGAPGPVFRGTAKRPLETIFKYFIYLFLEKEGKGGRKKERNIDVREKRQLVACHTPTGD